MTKLSILICTMPLRKEMFDNLLMRLNEQIALQEKDSVEVLSNDSMSITTGEKRNLLIQMAKGEFVVFIDDDDDVYDYYVNEILTTLNENPNIDCVGINGIISFNGQNPKRWFISKAYKHWHESQEVYYRTPNHISPVRKKIAEKVPFPNEHHGEDFVYSMGILPFLHEEAIIEKPLYHYQTRQNLPQPHIENNEPYRPAWR